MTCEIYTVMYQIAFCANVKCYLILSKQGTELEQVIQTHQTFYQSS